MAQMNAVVITAAGGPEVLHLQQVTIREPGQGEMRVRVRAAGVNRADLLQRRGLYPPPPGWPAEIPGLEYAGEVESVGDGVALWQAGDRVMGLVGGGGYAEFVVVPEREAIAVPAGTSFEEAAAIPEVFITAHDALFTQLGLGLGERLLIHAVGSGVGTAALQLAKVAGATVLGTSRSAWKLERARELGLDVAIDSSKEDVAEAVGRATGGEGVHAILDLVGGPYLAASLESLNVKGRMIIVGLTAGRTAEVDLGSVLRKRLHIVGTSLRTRPLEERIAAARAFDRNVGELLASGRVRPIIDRVFAFDQAVEAHRHMESNANFGKILLSLD
jgi:putative PIG3 family NAD(P)H quinone oxidoreductase